MSKADAAVADKLLVVGASASGVGHSVVGTDVVEAETGGRKVGAGAAESAAVGEVGTGMGASREVGIRAAKSAAVVEAEVGTGTGTLREAGIVRAAESTAVVEAVGIAAVETGTGTSR